MKLYRRGNEYIVTITNNSYYKLELNYDFVLNAGPAEIIRYIVKNAKISTVYVIDMDKYLKVWNYSRIYSIGFYSSKDTNKHPLTKIFI